VLLAALAVLASAGCNRRPSAPALGDAPVYQNNREGFRFLVPENWTQVASGVLPRGELEGEVLLVKYRMRTAGKGALLEVLCFDASKYPDVQKYHSEPSHGSKDWQSTGPVESLEINGTPAQRLVFSASIQGKPMVKEIVAFQREGRVYSFIGLFWESDNKARQQLRRAVGSIIWRD
jgi:hypothetical protein